MPNPGHRAKGLSQTEFPSEKPTIESRRIAIIIGDGYDQVAFEGMKMAIKAAGALAFVIGTKRSPIYAQGQSPENSDGVIADHMYDGQRSTMFDATFVPGGSHITTLSKNGQLRFWIVESFGHLKALGATGEACEFFKQVLGKAIDVQLASSASTDSVEWYGVVTAGKTKPESFKEGFQIAKAAKDFVGQFFYQISLHRNYPRELDGLSAALDW
jgi:catalase